MKINAISHNLMTFKSNFRPQKTSITNKTALDLPSNISNDDVFKYLSATANSSYANLDSYNDKNFFFEDIDGLTAIVENGKVVLKTNYADNKKITIFYAKDGKTPQKAILMRYDPDSHEESYVEKTYYNTAFRENQDAAYVAEIMEKYKINDSIKTKTKFCDGYTVEITYKVGHFEHKPYLIKHIELKNPDNITCNVTERPVEKNRKID